MVSLEDVSRLNVTFSEGEFHYNDWHKGVYITPCEKLKRYVREITGDKSRDEKVRSQASEMVVKLDASISYLDGQLKKYRSLEQKNNDLLEEFESLEADSEAITEESERLTIEFNRLKRDYDRKTAGKQTISREFFESRGNRLDDIVSRKGVINVELENITEKMKNIVEENNETVEEMEKIDNSLTLYVEDFFKLARDICDFLVDAINDKEEIIKEEMHARIVTEKSPLELLKIRLAKGEITLEEYERTKKVIEE